MKTLMIAVAGSLVVAGAAEAGDWLYASHSEKTVVGFDLSGVRKSGDQMLIWAIFVKRTSETVANARHDYRLARMRIDCGSFTLTDLSAIYYTLDSPTPTYSTDVSLPERAITPDSITEELANVACMERSSRGNGEATAREFALAMRADWPQ